MFRGNDLAACTIAEHSLVGVSSGFVDIQPTLDQRDVYLRRGSRQPVRRVTACRDCDLIAQRRCRELISGASTEDARRVGRGTWNSCLVIPINEEAAPWRLVGVAGPSSVNAMLRIPCARV